MYDPTTARWTSRDPAGFDAGDMNLYRYVGNDMPNATDPTGCILFAASESAAKALQEWLVGREGELLEHWKLSPEVKAEVYQTAGRWAVRPTDVAKAKEALTSWRKKEGFYAQKTVEVLEALVADDVSREGYWIKTTAGPFYGKEGSRDFRIRNTTFTGVESDIKTITVDKAPGYDGYPVAVHNVHNILLGVLLDGLDPDRIDPEGGEGNDLQPKLLRDSPFTLLPTIFSVMGKICKNIHGDGWRPVPLQFRLTGLKFLDIEKGFPPRKEIVNIHYSGDDGYKNSATSKKVALAHFFVDGYWVFMCKKGSETSGLYAIATDYKIHTRVHSPYDEKYAEELKTVVENHKNDKSFILGRSYDRRADYDSAPYFTGSRLTALKQLSDMTIMVSKEKSLEGIKPENIFDTSGKRKK